MTQLETMIAIRPDITLALPLLAMLAAATFIDVREHRIPNGLSLGAAVIGVSMQAALFGATGAVLAVLGWAVGLICLIPLYATGGMGAGDVKLMAAVGAFLGPVNVLFACVATAIAGGVLGLGYLASRRFGLVDGTHAGGAAVGAAHTGGGKMPYAAAIALGTAVVVLEPPFLAFILPSGGWS